MNTDGMSRRVVAAIPLKELWNPQGPLDAKRLGIIGPQELTARLSARPVQFVVADCGHPLQWIAVADTFEFWKSEVKPHLVDSVQAQAGFHPEDFPGEYCYLASEWSGLHNLILLEKYH